MPDITIRLETPGDYRAVVELTREAFWGFSRPTCDEHYLAHVLRPSPAFVPELDFVAEVDGELAGNVMYSKAKVEDAQGAEHTVLTFGPLSVSPRFQSLRVGSALVRHSILRARDMGYRGIVIYGNPDYYPRFGFQNAQVFGITSAGGANFDALMALELYEGALRGSTGRFLEDPLFDCDPVQVQEYDRLFPPKEPAQMVPFQVLLDQIPGPARQAFEQREIEHLVHLNRLSGRELLAWEGIDEAVLAIINRVLRQYGIAPRLLPGCAILENAKQGIKGLEEMKN